jgi:predicted AAA+ superfamily ATPase
MDRSIDRKLLAWKLSSTRKPLVLQGARQVGKTFAVCKFGKTHFQQIFKLDFLASKELIELFNSLNSYAPKNIIQQLEFYFRKKINIESDLIFFDEIQECPSAIASLKYFMEEMPDLAIICAGSYLGIMTNDESFPVGKVEYLSMTPCTFGEFLPVLDPQLGVLYAEIDVNDHTQIPTLYHHALLKIWRSYLALGGMPEVINVYMRELPQGEFVALSKARITQQQLLEGYRSDFSKHSGKVNANHISHVFDAIPSQLSKAFDESVARFHFTGVVPNQKGFDRIRGPLTWLIKARLILKTFIANKAENPLKGYCEENRFKLYFFDVGLLQASLLVPMEAIVGEGLGSYKGFIVENFVAQELFNQLNSDLFSWSEGTSEVEFIINQGKHLLPIEAKSSAKFSRTKSLNAYVERYKPTLAYKLSLQNRGFEPVRKMLTLPIYLIGKLELT